ncbi:sensor histidine kinase [Viridibacterium curvum]|uniref:histidine kinase n=1 Tax=Viridibacterium curvum TaxID=1101404 RepID=A0ABP9QJP0_9RHOO
MPSRIRRWGCSLSGRLLLAYIGAWLITAVLLGTLGSWLMRNDSNLAARTAERVLHYLTQQLHFDAQGRPQIPPLREEVQWIFDTLPLDAGYRVIDAQGRTLLWSTDATRKVWEGSPLTQMPPASPLTLSVQGVTLHLATQAVSAPDGRPLHLQVAISERLTALRHGDLGNTFGASFLLVSLISIVLLGLVLWAVLRRVMAPVQRISQEAERIEPRGPWRRLGEDGLPSEIAPLVRSFNQALNRLEEGFERQQRFLADAAHELKTPLALIRAHVELGGGGEERATALQDIDHMSRQIQQLLMLAEVSEPRSYQRDSIDVAAVMREVTAFLAPLATQHGVKLDVRADQIGTVDGDRSALFVLLKNLVENAIHVSPAGASVHLALSDNTLTVRDRGPGIAEAHLPHLFERFWRVPGSAEGGAGLGLAICQAVAQAHDWRLSAHNSNPGAEFRLAFTPPTLAKEPATS